MQHLAHVVYDAVPSSQNTISPDICKTTSFISFKNLLECHLFNEPYPSHAYLNQCSQPQLWPPNSPVLILLFLQLVSLSNIRYNLLIPYKLLTKLEIQYLELKEIPVQNSLCLITCLITY